MGCFTSRDVTTFSAQKAEVTVKDLENKGVLKNTGSRSGNLVDFVNFPRPESGSLCIKTSNSVSCQISGLSECSGRQHSVTSRHQNSMSHLPGGQQNQLQCHLAGQSQYKAKMNALSLSAVFRAKGGISLHFSDSQQDPLWSLFQQNVEQAQGSNRHSSLSLPTAGGFITCQRPAYQASRSSAKCSVTGTSPAFRNSRMRHSASCSELVSAAHEELLLVSLQLFPNPPPPLQALRLHLKSIGARNKDVFIMESIARSGNTIVLSQYLQGLKNIDNDFLFDHRRGSQAMSRSVCIAAAVPEPIEGCTISEHCNLVAQLVIDTLRE
ncbi:hypothetical protein CEUSTIGMA_g10492.t1 [Chlamydomonas eustigma]|uniref:Uncharacterized protein n=1 Tax=Chlamydomonas eustigma TaxID=1157962 RepID=A0A250XJ69_9CHLO|nr:hypothetical protein CEUSTIGMA_g10492.t1 [Chlamydomonas eustigma]|eukprot:GAX83066.1 hypothetical protein CEUSTIGMA_g10492.t1 [Chlamydomonas eustigma]